jgi:hypothetical protein
VVGAVFNTLPNAGYLLVISWTLVPMNGHNAHDVLVSTNEELLIHTS